MIFYVYNYVTVCLQVPTALHVMLMWFMQYTVFANSTSLLSLRESFAIPVGPVTSLAASPNGSLLYVLTPNKVRLLFIAKTSSCVLL